MKKLRATAKWQTWTFSYKGYQFTFSEHVGDDKKAFQRKSDIQKRIVDGMTLREVTKNLFHGHINVDVDFAPTGTLDN